jgi:VanZ family protein
MIMRKRIYILLFCLILCFIWGNSMLSKEASGAISHFVATILGGNREPSEEGHHLVRKLAHFCEFMSLGAVSVLLCRETLSRKGERALFCAFVGAFVPLADETLQIFTQRGPSLSDVWIDIGGFACGCIIVAVAFLIAFALSARRASAEKSEAPNVSK